ncbi:heterotrimeric G-protein alpha subunit, GPA2-like protein [Mycena sp. CBHHK59/15]|nr:heterotrimeric G-protein alpha subunit, GPA2-like protein [Mycena sp. CBHHK59/15]
MLAFERHHKAERQLIESKAKMSSQAKVLVLGSGDSGKSTIVQRMRILHSAPFSIQEIEYYRRLVFDNLTYGLKYLIDALSNMGLALSEDLETDVEVLHRAESLHHGEPFPERYFQLLTRLWEDNVVWYAWGRENEAALPENLHYFFSALPRLFSPAYMPTNEDIVRVHVGGQNTERRKWIHCFQDVTNILFVVNLSGYDQCLVEDRDVNQMQDAMTIWDSICQSQWFKQTPIIICLNKYEIFKYKIAMSDVRNFFPDFDGQLGDVIAGQDYFQRQFRRIAQKAGRVEHWGFYMHTTTATDTMILRVVMNAVKGLLFPFMPGGVHA